MRSRVRREGVRQGREGAAGVGEAIDKPHLDLTTKIGQGFLAFLSALAEDERERIVIAKMKDGEQ